MEEPRQRESLRRGGGGAAQKLLHGKHLTAEPAGLPRSRQGPEGGCQTQVVLTLAETTAKASQPMVEGAVQTGLLNVYSKLPRGPTLHCRHWKMGR